MKKKRQKEYKESRKKGYNQKGENNNNWKSGIGAYTRLAFEEYGKDRICERCGSKHNILVHHRDRNRYNNKKGNLEVLCKSCHQKEHEAGKNLHLDSKAFKSNKV
jgi:5-methylcytosine-specific restriction endonuclease McrA